MFEAGPCEESFAITLKEAIQQAKEIVESTTCKGCAQNHQQLVDWLQELSDRRKADDRTIILPVPIGAPVYVPFSYDELDGSVDKGVEELHLSGYFKEGEREIYLTYDNSGICDIKPKDLFTNREAAEAALAEGRST